MLAMPYQVKSGSFLVVAPTLAEAIKRYDDLKRLPDGVAVWDMEGREIEVDRLRHILNEGEPS